LGGRKIEKFCSQSVLTATIFDELNQTAVANEFEEEQLLLFCF
jgi:hypothetical protein